MNEIYNHKTISFCWPFGPRDSGPVGKPIIPHLRRYQGFAVVHYSVTLVPCIWGILDFRSIGVIKTFLAAMVILSMLRLNIGFLFFHVEA